MCRRDYRAEANDHPLRPPRKALIVQLGDIGDVVLTTPTIRAVAETWPGTRVSILVRKGIASLLRADPHIDRIFEAGKSGGGLREIRRENLCLVRALRREKFDLAIDLRTGDRGAIMTFLSGARVRVGRHEKGKPFWHDHAFTRIVEPKEGPHAAHPGADQSLRVVREIGVDTSDTAPRLQLAPEDLCRATELLAGTGLAPADRWVTVSPFSRWKYKEWDYERWAEVIDWLWQDRRIASVIVGSREEAAAAADIADRCGPHAHNFAGKTSLGELAALISLAILHVGVDSAPPHIAAAVGTPTVTIFGPSNWKSWTVQDATHRVVTTDMDCVPCGNKGCNDSEQSICLDRLEAGRLENVLGEVLPTIGGRR